MTTAKNEKRDSKALEPELITDPIAKAEAEARNGLRQYDVGIKSIQTALVNDNWFDSTPLHLGSYIMWRLNWIHPFADGNGRTSRILSYVVLSIRAGAILPGTPTIPDQIVDDRAPYFDALDAADSAFKEGKIDLSRMEALLGSLLARQLTGFYQSVGGRIPSDGTLR